MLSRSAAYALRAVLLLAEFHEYGEAHVPAARIASRLEVPGNYLSKVLHQLAGAGVLASQRGPGGGFSLSTRPEDLTVQRVVGPFEPLDDRALCVLRRGRCDHESPCEAHAHWSAVAEATQGFFERTTVSALREAGRAAAR